MGFLNLTLVEFLAVFLPTAAAVVALYLYDRSHRRQIVSTLRFFEKVSRAPILVRRKKIQQPWSLLLQLVSIALLLLAVADLELGRPAERARDHVLILETSAWMNSASNVPRASWMQVAHRRALDYLKAVPAQDRVLLIRADQLATPATPFTRDRRELESVIRASEAGSTALNLAAALELAHNTQRLSSRRPGEIVFIGSGRVMHDDRERVASVDASNLRTILLGGEPNNAGIRKLAARRAPADPLSWDIDVGVYNYGASERRLRLTLTFAGSRAAQKTLTLGPHSSGEASFSLRAVAAGVLEASLDSKDDYRADNRATIELAKLTPLKIQVFTSRPSLWQPLLTASAALDPEFRRAEEYSTAGPARRLVIVDGFQPPSFPQADTVWIAPSRGREAGVTTVRRWNATHPLTAGLHNKDVRVSRATVLRAGPGDAVIAESDRGPVLTASQSGEFKKISFGFHPLEEGTESHLAIPLLFANLVRWISPELFRTAEVSAAPPGLIEIATRAETRPDQVHITAPQMRGLASTLVGNRLRLFAAQAGTVRVTLPERELVYTLSLPEVGEMRWTPPPGIRQGVPPAAGGSAAHRDLWPWLALAGALGLLAEWMLYGRQPVAAAPAARRPEPVSLNVTPEPDREEVHT